MSSKARAGFEENKKDIDELWGIHTQVAGEGVGRKHGVDVLNRAAVVFVTACWESFVEDLVVEAFDFVLANVSVASAISSKVRDKVTKPLFEQKDSRKVWELADGGWRTLMIAHKAATIESWLGNFHTPKSANIDALYDSLLGMPNVSSNWHWQGMGKELAATKLDEYVSIRGDIAHRTRHNETVYKSWGTDYLGHVQRLVQSTDEAVLAHVKGMCGKAPW